MINSKRPQAVINNCIMTVGDEYLTMRAIGFRR